MTALPRKTPAVFYRGGTSKAVFFKAEDVPENIEERDIMLRAVMGSPDPYGRQLDGLGGGISSLSKAMWVKKSTRNDADVDYTFAQVGIRDGVIDLSSNCGNMTSTVGPFAIEEGIFPLPDGPATVRMFNTNTNKIVHAHFTIQDGRAVSTGNMEIPGVSGTGAPMRLDWMDPAGTAGRGVLPTGKPQEMFSAPGFGEFPGSIVDAAAVCVYIPASVFGLTCAERPEAIDAMPGISRYSIDRLVDQVGEQIPFVDLATHPVLSTAERADIGAAAPAAAAPGGGPASAGASATAATCGERECQNCADCGATHTHAAISPPRHPAPSGHRPAFFMAVLSVPGNMSDVGLAVLCR